MYCTIYKTNSLPAQPISIRKAESRKTAHIPLCTMWISQQMCQPHLLIIKSCYFDYRINKSFTCFRCMICIWCSVHDVLDVLRAQRIIYSRLYFILTTHKSTTVGPKIQSECYSRIAQHCPDNTWPENQHVHCTQRKEKNGWPHQVHIKCLIMNLVLSVKLTGNV